MLQSGFLASVTCREAAPVLFRNIGLPVVPAGVQNVIFADAPDLKRTVGSRVVGIFDCEGVHGVPLVFVRGFIAQLKTFDNKNIQHS
jgi:hypothetical protein